MPPVVEFVDAEAMVRAFLDAQVTPPVSTKIPNPRPARYTRAWRTGGYTVNRVLEVVQITVSCTAADSVTASADATAARSAFLNQSTAMPLVRGVEGISGPYSDPDPDTNEDRYTLNVQLRVRAAR